MVELSVLCVCRHQPVSFMAKCRRFLRQRPPPSTQDLLMVSSPLFELGAAGGRATQCGHHSQLSESLTLSGLPHLTNTTAALFTAAVGGHPRPRSNILFQTFSTAYNNIGICNICFRDLLPSPLLHPSPPLPPTPLLPSSQVLPSCMDTGSPSTTERPTRYLPAMAFSSTTRAPEEVNTSTVYKAVCIQLIMQATGNKCMI